MELPNWIEGENRWRLAKPPQWFLLGLYNFDAQLVIIPSKMEPAKGAKPYYLLARRALRTGGMGRAVLLDNKHPDTNMCMVHGLVPVAPLRFRDGLNNSFTQGGLDSLIADLKSRDQWAISDSDGDKVADHIEQNEQRANDKQRAGLRDMFYHMARDAYRSLKARTGQRNKRASDYHGVARATR